MTRPLDRDTNQRAEQVARTDLPILEGPFLPEAILPGTLVADRYEVLKRVAHDGMGIVYKALNRNREAAGAPRPWVALKFARPAGGV